MTEGYRHVRATPSIGDWYVLWQLGEVEGTIEIVVLAELTF